MKNLLLVPCILLAASALELRLDATSEVETQQFGSVETLDGLFDFLIGDWEGAGT